MEEAHISLNELLSQLEKQPLYEKNICPINLSKKLNMKSVTSAANKLENMLNLITEDADESEVEEQREKYVVQSKKNRTSKPNIAKRSRPPTRPNAGRRQETSAQNNLPSLEEVLYLLKINEDVKNSLSSEVEVLRQELNNIKDQVINLVHENNLLHNELRKTAMEAIQEQNTSNQNILSTNSQHVAFDAKPLTYNASIEQDNTINNFKIQHWQKELEKLSKVYSNKCDILSNQLTQLRAENAKITEELDTTRNKLKSIALQTEGQISGLCIDCAGRQAVVTVGLDRLRQQQIDNLTKERNEFSQKLTILQASLKEMQLREEGCYLQVKNAVSMTEQAHMEMTQAYIERQQVKNEYDSLKTRFEEHLQHYEKRIGEECDLVNQRNQSRISDLNNLNTDLLTKVADLETSVERLSRERVILQTDLEIQRSQMLSQEEEHSKSITRAKFEANNAINENNFTQKQTVFLKRQLNQVEEEKHKEKTNLKDEISSLSRRLNEAERGLLDSKEQLLNSQNDKLQVELQVEKLKLEKSNIEKTLAEDLLSRQSRARQREEEMNLLIDQLELKFARTKADFEENLKEHEALIKKLKTECKNLVLKLEQTITCFKKLKHENGQLRCELRRKMGSSEQAAEQLSIQLLLQDKVRQRLKEKDAMQADASLKIEELLSREATLLKEKQLLSKHVDYLQNHLVLPQEINTLNSFNELQ